MSALRPVETAGYPEIAAPASFGKPARLEWIAVKQLAIDPEYQREIGRLGKKNVLKIAGAFDWSMFTPVIVAPAGGGKYAIVDGQHRSTAAALCGIDRVPCAIIDGARAAQAAAFAAINTVVTAMSPLQVHAAKLAAGDETAVALVRSCEKAGVTILRSTPSWKDIKRGQTIAAAKLYQLLKRFGETTLVVALRCITETREGYPGFIRAQIVEALCNVLEAEPEWRDSSDLLAAMEKINIADAFSEARKETEGSRSGVVSELIKRFDAHLAEYFEQSAMPAAPKKVAPAAMTPKAVVSAVKPAIAPVKAPPATKVESEAVTFGAVTVELGEGIEAIEHKGKRKSVTWRQAEFFAALAKGMPNPIGRKFLCTKLFGGKGTEAQSDVQLDLLAADAKLIANAIGLDVRSTKGIGIALTLA
jgi:hypothetical protein